VRAEVEHDLALDQLIYDLRTGAGLSQRELAGRMGTTQSVISRLEEGGGARNRIDTLARVAEALGRHLSCRSPRRSPPSSRTPCRSPDRRHRPNRSVAVNARFGPPPPNVMSRDIGNGPDLYRSGCSDPATRLTPMMKHYRICAGVEGGVAAEKEHDVVATDSNLPERYAKSVEAHARRSAVIAGGVNSNVRLMSRPVPLTFARADGAFIWDIDDNQYVDYAGGMGPMVLGHNHPRVLAAVRSALDLGQCFAGQNRFEAEFGERLVEVVPWIESIRIGLAGSDVDLLAVRIARAATRRAKVLRFVGHYHGWLDPLLVGSGPMPEPFGRPPIDRGQSLAASEDVVICEWNDLELVEQILATEEIACVIMEPIMCNTGVIPPAPGYLEGVRDLCGRHGSLLVIDEVITGFRMGLTGAQGFLGISGDITLYAKAVASGYPMSVLGTTHELLAAVGRGEVNHSGTYNAGTLSVAAAVETLKILTETDPYPELEQRTVRLVSEIRSLGANIGLAIDHAGGSLFQFRFGPSEPSLTRAQFAKNSDPARLTRFMDALQDNGIRPTSRGLCFVSVAHDDDVIDMTLERIEAAVATL
jgi:glutamate-1-semialdehyde 2,1-aminomutase